MKRRDRLRSNRDFQEVRQKGKAYSNQLLVLCCYANDLPHSRFGFSVSKRIGNAVTRNRIKRQLREIVRVQIGDILPGWDLVFIAKNPIREADFHQMDHACARLLRRAQLLIPAAPPPAQPDPADGAAEATALDTGQAERS